MTLFEVEVVDRDRWDKAFKKLVMADTEKQAIIKALRDEPYGCYIRKVEPKEAK